MYTETRRHRVFDYYDDDDDDFLGRASPSTSEGTRERRGVGTRTYLSEHKKCVTDRREVILLQPIVISHLRPHVLPLSHIYACLTTPGPNAACLSPRGRGNEGARGRENLLQQIVISHLRPHALPLSLIYAGLPTPGSNAARISSVSMLVDILPMKTCNSTTMAAIVFKLSVK